MIGPILNGVKRMFGDEVMNGLENNQLMRE